MINLPAILLVILRMDLQENLKNLKLKLLEFNNATVSII